MTTEVGVKELVDHMDVLKRAPCGMQQVTMRLGVQSSQLREQGLVFGVLVGKQGGQHARSSGVGGVGQGA